MNKELAMKEIEDNFSKELKERKENNQKIIEKNKKNKTIIWLSLKSTKPYPFIASSWFVFTFSSLLSITLPTPLLLGGVLVTGEIVRRIIYKIAGLDKTAFQTTKIKNEEEKEQDYLNRLMETEKANNRNKAATASWNYFKKNNVMMREISVDGTQDDIPNSKKYQNRIDNLTEQLTKEQEELDKISMKQALKKEWDTKLSHDAINGASGVLLSACCLFQSLAIFPIAFSAYVAGLLTVEMCMHFANKNRDKCREATLKSIGLTMEDIICTSKKEINQELNKQIEKISETEGLIQLNKMMKKTSEIREMEKGQSKASGKAIEKKVEQVIDRIPDDVLASLTQESEDAFENVANKDSKVKTR